MRYNEKRKMAPEERSGRKPGLGDGWEGRGVQRVTTTEMSKSQRKNLRRKVNGKKKRAGRKRTEKRRSEVVESDDEEEEEKGEDKVKEEEGAAKPKMHSVVVKRLPGLIDPRRFDRFWKFSMLNEEVSETDDEEDCLCLGDWVPKSRR